MLNSDGTRKIVIVRDYGFEVKREQVKIKPFKTRAERNAEIYRRRSSSAICSTSASRQFHLSLTAKVNSKIQTAFYLQT